MTSGLFYRGFLWGRGASDWLDLSDGSDLQGQGLTGVDPTIDYFKSESVCDDFY